MPQENQVLRCYSCNVFQVHIVKKGRKWECKMCGSKQSIKKIYGRGSGKDCRIHVMKLNTFQFSESQTSDCSVIDEGENESSQNKTPNVFSGGNNQIESKWLGYYDDGNECNGKSDFENPERENCHSSGFYHKNKKSMDTFCYGTQKQLDLELLEGSHDGNDCENVKRSKGNPYKNHPVISCQDYSLKSKSKWLDYVKEEMLEEKEKMNENEYKPVVAVNEGSDGYHTRHLHKPQKPVEPREETNDLHVLKQQCNETISNHNNFTEGTGTTMIKTCGESNVIKKKPKIFNALCEIDNLDDILDF